MSSTGPDSYRCEFCGSPTCDCAEEWRHYFNNRTNRKAGGMTIIRNNWKFILFLAVLSTVVFIGVRTVAEANAQVPTLGLSPACEAAIFAGGSLEACVNEVNPTYTGPTCESNPEREGCAYQGMDPAWTAYYSTILRIKARATRCKVKSLLGLATRRDRRFCRRYYRKYDISFPSTPYDPVIGREPVGAPR